MQINRKEQKYMLRKRLKIKPHNEFWFQNCLMHALAQITGSLGIIDCLLFDNIFVYENGWEEERPTLIIKQEYHKGWVKCLEEKNIYAQFISCKTNELIDKIKRSINKDCPVITYVDCYYESLRKDSYKKIHLTHNLLITGYDDDKMMFHVLEHNYEDDLYYKEQDIPYYEVIDASVGYIKNINKQNDITFIEIDSRKANQSKTSKQVTIDLNIVAIDKMINSLPAFKRFIKNIEPYLIQSIVSKETIASYYQMIRKIVNLKRVYYSQIEIIHVEYNFPNTELLFKILNDWNILMGLFGKMFYSGCWSKKIFIKVITYFNSIYQAECLWFADAKNELMAN